MIFFVILIAIFLVIRWLMIVNNPKKYSTLLLPEPGMKLTPEQLETNKFVKAYNVKYHLHPDRDRLILETGLMPDGSFSQVHVDNAQARFDDADAYAADKKRTADRLKDESLQFFIKHGRNIDD